MSIKVANRIIQNFSEPMIIAEVGANHNGDLALAEKLIKSAAQCGAHCVKFQSWTESSLICKSEYERNRSYDDSPKKHFGSLQEMVKKYQLSMEQHQVLSKICRQNNVMFCSTPFSVEEAEFLDSLNVPFFKVASMDINHPRLLRCIASKQKPVILSTGMATLSEIDNAVRIIESENNRNIIILHCISLYPPAPEDIHLNNIKTLMSAFPDYPIGFSDHSIGTSIPLGATALGAAVIEKHFTLDKNMEGWDHEISADPSELSYLVKESAFLVKAMGNTKRIVSKTEQEKLKKFRRSIVLARDMKAGEKIEATDLNFKRPGTHISPDLEPYVVGRTLKKALNSDDLVSFEDLE